jgi:hypothetical protein
LAILLGMASPHGFPPMRPDRIPGHALRGNTMPGTHFTEALRAPWSFEATLRPVGRGTVVGASGSPLQRTIAVDLDDTLNNFTETLRETRFEHDGSCSFSKEVFDQYLAEVRSGSADSGDLLSTEYAFFKYRIHQRCYEQARARRDGVDFMRRLRADGWRIVICTYRDLRRANTCTRKWLADNGIPFDHLFMAWNKIVFCKAWGIEHLVDDHEFNAKFGSRYGVNVYYPIREGQGDLSADGARGFRSFEEIGPWIQG